MVPTKTEAPDPGYQGWRGAPPFISIATCYSDNGGAIFWGLQYNYELSVIAEDLTGWSKWFRTEWSGPGQPKRMVEMAATAIENNGLQFWTLDDMLDLSSAAMGVPGNKFSPWVRNWNGSPRLLRRLAAVHRRDTSSAAIWAIQSDYSLISCDKRAPENTWSPWKPWPLTPEKTQFIELAAALQYDGRAALWAIDTNLQLWCCYEMTLGGKWSNWNGPNWNGAPKLFSIAACQQGGSHGAALWGVKQAGYELINTCQTTPSGSWSNWSADGWQNSKPVIRLAAALQKNGTVRLWATQARFLRLRSIAQTSPGGDWGAWEG
jgi:hypothetical protein